MRSCRRRVKNNCSGCIEFPRATGRPGLLRDDLRQGAKLRMGIGEFGPSHQPSCPSRPKVEGHRGTSKSPVAMLGMIGRWPIIICLAANATRASLVGSCWRSHLKFESKRGGRSHDDRPRLSISTSGTTAEAHRAMSLQSQP